ncbi:MAG: ATP-binding protein [Halobacteriota archaeon]
MNVETLKPIIVDQKEEVERIFREEKIIEREFLTTWKSSIESRSIKIITGVRRTGKSIFSLQLLEGKKYAYINFDDERLAGINTKDLNLVLQAFYELYGDIKYVFLDEIQNIGGWELFVNRLHRMGLNVVVTGSNANLLSRELASHLTGRHIPIEIYPFSFREFLNFENFKITKESLYSTKQKSMLVKKMRDYIEWGGFPESVKDRDNAKLYLSTLYSTILTKDVISRYNLKYVQTLKEIANYLLSNFSQPISYHKIKNIFEMGSTHTAKNYTSYLEETYMIYLLSKFSFKHKELLASSKKAYVIDTGLINSLTFRMSENMGRLMENVVLVELLRRKSTELEIYYWKDYQQREVDFVVKQGTEVIQLIQVTYAESEINQRETKALIRASDSLRCKNLICITWDYEDSIQVDSKTIKCIPLWKWLIQEI